MEPQRLVRARGRLSFVVGTVLMALMFAALAYADDISNTLDASVDANFEAMALNVGGGTGSTTLIVTPRNGDGKNGCNLTGSTTLGVSVASSNTSVATVSPTSLTFGSCGDEKTITVTPVATGTANVTLSQTSNNTGGTFNFAPATFTVTVAPPPNTAPVVQVTGVTHGGSYSHGSVPVAGCLVSDTEDGLTNSTSAATATLSSFTGPYAADGIGAQTAECSYTDGGGLTQTVQATYTVDRPVGASDHAFRVRHARSQRLVPKRCHPDVACRGATVAFVSRQDRVCRPVDHCGSGGDYLQLLGDERGWIVGSRQRGDQAGCICSDGHRGSVHTSERGRLVQGRGHPQLDVRRCRPVWAARFVSCDDGAERRGSRSERHARPDQRQRRKHDHRDEQPHGQHRQVRADRLGSHSGHPGQRVGHRLVQGQRHLPMDGERSRSCRWISRLRRRRRRSRFQHLQHNGNRSKRIGCGDRPRGQHGHGISDGRQRGRLQSRPSASPVRPPCCSAGRRRQHGRRATPAPGSPQQPAAPSRSTPTRSEQRP